MLRKLLCALLPVIASATNATADPAVSSARDWIARSAGHATAEWVDAGTLALPSGSIFIGDPSWGDDYHMRGAKKVPAQSVQVWLLTGRSGEVHVTWLEAGGTTPVRSNGGIVFGMDSAYFAFGDEATGNDLATIGKLGLPDANDSFEFFLARIENENFNWLRLDVPPAQRPVYAVNTRSDGSLKAAWLFDADDAFSGILIDVTGRKADNVFIDSLLPERD